MTDKNPRMTDGEILSWALSEKTIIVTTDKDFEEMISPKGKSHCGVLRLENLPHREKLELIRDVLSRHSDDLEADTLSLVLPLNFVYKNSVHDTAFCY